MLNRLFELIVGLHLTLCRTRFSLHRATKSNLFACALPSPVLEELSHPHVCTLYDFGLQDGIDYLVMEYLEGETLERRLQRGALPVAQVLTYAMQIASALDKAHRLGIVSS
jgi:serine/threonine protein kinase